MTCGSVGSTWILTIVLDKKEVEEDISQPLLEGICEAIGEESPSISKPPIQEEQSVLFCFFLVVKQRTSSLLSKGY